MRGLLMLCYGLLVTLPAMAQHVETLVGAEAAHGGFGGPFLTLTSVAGEPAVMMGGGGAWVLNHRLFFGGAGHGLVSDVSAGTESVRLGYGGLWMGVLFQSERLIHAGMGLLLGGGHVATEDMEHERKGFFAFEPHVFGELNVSVCFRVTLGFAYRWISSVRLASLDASDLRGWGLRLGFKFGSQ